jgi:NTE family protein
VDLIFSSQSQRILEAGRREHRLRAMIAHLAARLPPELRRDSQIAAVLAEARAHAPTVLYLSYRAGADEAGPEKVFDFSRATLTERWEAGACDMQAALRILGTVPVDVSSDGLAVYHIQGQASAA